MDNVHTLMCNKTYQIPISCRSLWSMNIDERMPFQVFIIWVKFSPSLSKTQVFTQLSSYQWILLLVYTPIIAKLTYEKVNIIRANLNNISHPWKEIKWGSGKSGLFQVSATRIIIESHSTEVKLKNLIEPQTHEVDPCRIPQK